MTISNLKKTWTNTALSEFGLAKPDIRQLPWPKVKFKGDFLTIFDFTLSLFKALSQDGYTIIPSFTKHFGSWWQQPLGKTWDLQCKNGAMTHISRKTKSHRQLALFL